MAQYSLIALDMDGTLLDSKKQISPPVLAALQRAADSGKYCVLSTGRAISELSPYIDTLSCVQYGICESGALLYDFRVKKVLAQKSILPEVVQKVVEVSKTQDTMVQIMSEGTAIAQTSQTAMMEKWHMSQYKHLYQETGTLVDNIYATIARRLNRIEKINIFHLNVDERKRTYEALKSLPLSFAFTEGVSLELSCGGVDKGAGLLDMAKLLGVPIEQTIAVGDGDNDIPILRKAALPIAMGNSSSNVKEICSVIVSDNDHDGVMQAINDYLLSH